MKKLTPMKAIRQKCLECSSGSANEVRLCPVSKCALYMYRFGHRPNTGEEDIKENDLDEKTRDTAAVVSTERK